MTTRSQMMHPSRGMPMNLRDKIRDAFDGDDDDKVDPEVKVHFIKERILDEGDAVQEDER
jgi:hypothetical protein